jgi:hypothetical protein
MFDLSKSAAKPGSIGRVGGWRQCNLVVFATVILAVLFLARSALGSSAEAVLYFNVGNKAFQSGDLTQAEREYRPALKIDPSLKEGPRILGPSFLRHSNTSDPVYQVRYALQ